MAQGAILTSEILRDDNLDALIAKMRTLEGIIENLTGAIKKEEAAAQQLEATTRTLNGTTANGREQIVKAAKATDEIERATRTYNAALSANAKHLAELRAKITEQNRLTKLETALTNAKVGSYNALSAQYSLNVIRLNAMSSAERRLTKEGRDLVSSTKAVRSEMTALQSELGNNTLKVGSYENAIGGLKNRFTDFVKGGFIVSGVYAIIQGVQQLGRAIFKVNSEVSDALGDVQRIAQLTDTEAKVLLQSIKAIDTRTGVTDLLKLAAVGARLGVAAPELSKFAKSIDDINVALGGELGGDVEGIANTLGKLSSIFIGGEITGEKIQKIGNAIISLANAGVASGPFLADLAQRLAGISGIADQLELGDALGLGAAFEELGASAEVAGTAVTQILLKMSQDVPKFARLAQKDVKEFSKTLNEDPVEALIQLAEGLQKNKSGLEEMSTAFAEAEVKGVRVAATLGVLGSDTEKFRGKILDARAALQSNNEILDAVAIKQDTLAANTAKLKNAFDKLIQGEGVTGFLKSIVVFATDVINSFLGIGDAIGALINPFEKLKTTFETQNQQLSITNERLPVLLSQYGELNAKTTLTKDEHEKMSATIKEITDFFPQAITAWDEYGNVIAFSKDKVIELAIAQDKLNQTTKDALIKGAEAEIKKIEKQIAKLDKSLEYVKTLGMSDERLNNSIIINLQSRGELSKKLQENKQLLASLRGETDKSIAATDDETKANDKSKSSWDGNTSSITKNTKAKKDNLSESDRIAIKANEEKGFINELSDLMAKEAKEAQEELEKAFAEMEKELELNVPIKLTLDNTKLTTDNELTTTPAQLRAQGQKDKPEDIFDLLGFNFEDADKARIKEGFDFAKGQLSDYLAFRTEIANRNVANADREVQAAQEALNNEMADRRAGLANLVETRQKDFDDAKKRQEQALKQQEKVAKAERAIQTIQQATNLITGISKLFAEKNILAIPLAALMIGSFVGFKLAAIGAAKKQFGKGDLQILEGGSHASGNDIPLGTTAKDGRKEYAEGGEARMILPKDATAKYRSLLPEIFQALKQKRFENEFQRLGNAASDIPIIVHAGNGSTVNTGRMENSLNRLVKQGEVKDKRDANGKGLVIYKNLTQIYQ